MLISGWCTTEVNTPLMLLAGTQMIGTPWEEKASVLKGQKQVHITAAQRKMWWGGAAQEQLFTAMSTICLCCMSSSSLFPNVSCRMGPDTLGSNSDLSRSLQQICSHRLRYQFSGMSDFETKSKHYWQLAGSLHFLLIYLKMGTTVYNQLAYSPLCSCHILIGWVNTVCVS